MSIIYCDLDDTLTSYDSCLYTKFKILKLLWYKIKPELWSREYKIQQKIIPIFQKLQPTALFILTRNDKEVVHLIQKDLAEMLSIPIKGHETLTTSAQKVEYMEKLSPQHENILLSDIFEYQTLQHYSKFICTEQFSLLRVIYLKFFKIFCIIHFILFKLHDYS